MNEKKICAKCKKEYVKHYLNYTWLCEKCGRNLDYFLNEGEDDSENEDNTPEHKED